MSDSTETTKVHLQYAGHVVEVHEPGASATDLLAVALTAWKRMQPAPGQHIGFTVAGALSSSHERSPNGGRLHNSFRRRLPHVTGMADKDDDTWIDVQPIGEAGDQ